MRRADLVAGLVLALLGLAMIVVVIPAETAAGVWYGLSPYFYPTLIMAGVVVASLLLVAQAWRRKAVHEGRRLDLDRWRAGMAALAALIVLAGILAIDHLGLWVGGPALIAGVMLFMGERRPLHLVATAVLPVAVVDLLVTQVLQAPLP